MPNSKISALTSATTPLAGTETLPVVQSSTTKQVSVANLTVGRIVGANGIAFPATQSASADPNTLDDYEEGTWTPSYGATTTDPTVTFGTQAGYYTKVGNLVYCFLRMNLSSASGGSGSLRITGLPFTPQNVTGGLHTTGYAYRTTWTTNGPDGGYIINNSAFVYLIAGANTGVTTLTPTNLSATAQLILSFTYTTAT
jgi:hypothetical protein